MIDWAHLLRPALLKKNSWLPVTLRLWLQWSAENVASALQMVLDRPVSLQLISAEKDLPAAVFGIELQHPALASGNAVVTVDLSAARLIVDAIETDFANLRGAGTVSEVEAGILEYATLAVLDQALRSTATSHPIRLIRFYDAREIQPVLESLEKAGNPHSATFQLETGGRTGTVGVIHGAWREDMLFAPPPPSNQSLVDLAAPLHLHLALPGVKLSAADFNSLAVGDLLLPGAVDLASFAGPCRILTSLGWSLAMAQVVQDSPTVISVRCGPLMPEVMPVSTADEQIAIVLGLIGDVKIPLGKLADWSPEATIDFPKDPITPVRIVAGLETIGSAELVLFEGEVGLRIIALTSASSSKDTNRSGS